MGHALDVLKNHALSDAHNAEGYPCFRRNWKEEYLQMLLTNTISQIFYSSENIMRVEAIEMHRFAADEDPEFMARALVYARNEGFMRLQPIIGLAVLSLVSPRLFKLIFDKVILIIPDLAEFTLVLGSLGRGQGGRAVKCAAAKKLASIDEYAAIKYAGDGRGYSLRDLMRVYHPKPRDEKSADLLKYISGKIDWDQTAPDALPQVRAIEALKKLNSQDFIDKSPEAAAIIREHRLPHNVVTGILGKIDRTVWAALMEDMPLFALVRHLATLESNGVIASAEPDERIIKRLTDGPAIHRAKILPFRFSQAWQQVETTWLRKALEEAVDLSVDCLPDIKGRTAVLLDVSGSMEGRFLMAGGVLALSAYRKAGNDGNFFLFDTNVEHFEIREGESIISAASRIKCGGGTDTGVALRHMTDENIFADNIVIVTDEQQNTGSPFYRELRRYRKKVNEDARAFVVDVAPYGGAMVPTEDEKTFYCFGWSDNIISFIAQNTEGYKDLAAEVSGIDLCWEQ